MIECNIDETFMTYCTLVKKGYGSITEIESWDTDKFYDVLDYENLNNDIETLVYEDAKNE